MMMMTGADGLLVGIRADGSALLVQLPPAVPALQLRFAFQTSKKLYMIMDYYPGGSLYFHIRRQRRFSFDQVIVP